MAGRIWLKIGRGTQDGWQSVLKEKYILKTHFKIMIFSFVERGERKGGGR
jgi:hypothetical protein